VILCTISASMQPEQGELARRVIASGVPVITVALRTPYDLTVYPGAGTHICTYGMHPPAMEALASALWGRAPFRGRLPVAIPGLYPCGHRAG
jgi:beta-N-acetylhexosaminidase